MSARRHTKFVREGSYAAEVDVELIEDDEQAPAARALCGLAYVALKEEGLFRIIAVGRVHDDVLRA